jgi:hypothetical protein
MIEIGKELLLFMKATRDGKWSDQEVTTWHEKLDKLASEVLSDKRLGRYLSLDDLADRFSLIHADLKDMTEKDMEEYVSELLATPKTYEFFFPAMELFGFPEGYRLGQCELHSYTQLPEEIQKRISSDWEYTYEREKIIYFSRTPEEYQKQKKLETYFCLKVEALGEYKATEVATRLANQGLNILKCFYLLEDVPRLRACHYRVGSSYGSVREERFKWGSYNHRVSAELETYLQLVNSFVQGGANDEIAKRTLSAIDIYGMMEKETALELKFLLSIMATESLLLGKDDKDFLGWKLREKVAILLGDTPVWIKQYLGKEPEEKLTDEECDKARSAARAELARNVRMIYDKRSALVHQDAGEEITEDDFIHASNIMRLSLHRILRLYNEKGVRRVSKTSTVDPQSLDGFIESMKYSVPLGW